jgi:hypothetical protein
MQLRPLSSCKLALLALTLATPLVAPGAARADNWTNTSTTAGGGIRTTSTSSKVGIGITGTGAIANTLDVEGRAAIGASYSGTSAAPTNGLIVQGNVGIGTASPGSDKLSVVGNVKATGTISADGGFKVKTWSMEVPDYVFDSAHYRPMALPKVEAYVKAHRHLPGVPGAAELHENGMDLASMNLILLRKVEELTLHLIDQDKRIAALSAARAK